MSTGRSRGPFEIMGVRFSVTECMARVYGERRLNWVSGKIGDMSLFTAIGW
jgi:hypothetical protein